MLKPARKILNKNKKCGQFEHCNDIKVLTSNKKNSNFPFFRFLIITEVVLYYAYFLSMVVGYSRIVGYHDTLPITVALTHLATSIPVFVVITLISLFVTFCFKHAWKKAYRETNDTN